MQKKDSLVMDASMAISDWSYRGASAAGGEPTGKLFCCSAERSGLTVAAVRTQLGLATWQTVLLLIVPPFLIALVIVWRAIHRATNHPDGAMGPKPTRKKTRSN